MSTDTIFVWDGIIEFSPGDKPGTQNVKWEGSLIAKENAPVASGVAEPARDAFQRDCASNLHFSVEGVAEPMDGSTDENLFKPFRMDLNKGAGWDYQGKKNTDNCHEILVESLQWRGSPDKRKSLVYARGSDSQGCFISTGWMRPGNRITLARRYVGESDPRAKWTVEQVRDEILKNIYDEEDDEIIMPPWHCNALNSNVSAY